MATRLPMSMPMFMLRMPKSSRPGYLKLAGGKEGGEGGEAGGRAR